MTLFYRYDKFKSRLLSQCFSWLKYRGNSEYVFLDNRNVNDKFDQTLLPLKDLKFDFGSVFKTFTVYSALKNQKIEINDYFDVDQPVHIGTKIINDYPRNSEIPMQVGDIFKKILK